jgi:integrase
MNKLITDANLGEFGLIDPRSVHRSRPLSEHLEDYRRHMRDKNLSPRQIEETTARVEAVVGGCNFGRPADLSAGRIAEYLAARRDKGMAIETSNGYVRACKAFTAWLVRDGRIGKDPLEHLSGLNSETDRRRVRRSLTPDEFRALIETARESRATVQRLDGPSRAMLYTVASLTGWRASELASLTPQSFDLEAGTIAVPAAIAKNRRAASIPVHGGLVAQLREWMKGRPKSERLWPGSWASRRRAAEVLRADLATAGIPYLDERGRVADFHSLRGLFATMLVRAGVHPKATQTLMRHSDVNLTMSIYADLKPDELRDAVERLEVPEVIPSRAKGIRKGDVG